MLNNALAIALLAAVGNALFAYGQRRAEIAPNPFLFVFGATLVCGVALLFTLPFFQRQDLMGHTQRNLGWIVLSGAGLYITNVGFYLLYSRFGASYYVLYAVLAILTTSVIVGLMLMRESMNGYQVAAMITALITVGLFALGQRAGL